ncbi:Rrf2 family transcriptional regulator [Limnohabitans sp.]|uniref:RrF2 family transcriptional regulator n=1 Tax=Limnohabitans sp. TaxID=1907725 RepID=UPI00286F1962|nr:Rrf2 family transcriptional regulator [Limnohabitans sp.]
MRLTTYTDYTLRVAMYLTLKYDSGELVTIDQIASAYDISHNHLTKIVHEMRGQGLIETTRGRSGGIRLARDPGAITIGEIVRWAEDDFALVECHTSGLDSSCVVFQVCNLQRGFRQALQAFMRELDAMTLLDAVSSPRDAKTFLGIPLHAA